MTREQPLFAVLITGTIGSGKTAIATAIGELLDKKAVPNAVIDLDWLGWAHLPPTAEQSVHDLIAANLAATAPNFIAAGIRHFVLARAFAAEGEVDSLQAVLPEARWVVVRVTASKRTISGRLRARDEGDTLTEHLAQAQEFAAAQEQALFADLDVSNDSRSIASVATEVLDLLGWIR